MDVSCTKVLNLQTCTFCRPFCQKEYAYEWCPPREDKDDHKKTNKESSGHRKR